MRRENWIVADNGIRPVSREENVCTYCREPRGNTHKPECVIRERTVVMRFEVEYVTTVPESWDVETIEFHRNEGGRCIDNTIHDLNARSEHWEKHGPTESPTGPWASRTCFCGCAKETYVREATERDEASHGVFVSECEG